MSKKRKTDEQGSDIDEKGQNWWKMKKILFVRFLSEKYGKLLTKVKNDENVSDIDENGQNSWKMKKKITFGFLSGKYGKMSKK